MTKKPYLGEILARKNLISCQQLDDALKEQKASGEFLGAILLRRHLISEKDLLECLAEQFNIPFLSIENRYIDWDLVVKFSSSLIVEHRCFPLEADDDCATFAINNPLDVWLLNEAERQAAPLRVKVALITQDEMDDLLQRYHKYMQDNIQRFFKEGEDA